MATYRAIPDFYDDEYADLEMLHEDVGFLLSRLPTNLIDVLMLACGTGRGSLPIAQAGHRVLGVDIDERMLAIAAGKRDVAGLSAAQLAFGPHDLLRLDVKRRFDLAAILFNSFLVFTTLAEQDRVLQNVARHLKPGGRFWIDVFNPDLAMLAEDEMLNADVRTFFSRTLNVGVQRATHLRATDRPQVRQTTYVFAWFDAKGRARRKTIKYELTYIFPRELVMLLERNGFIVDELFGDYDGSPVTTTSPRLIASARLSGPSRSRARGARDSSDRPDRAA